MTHIMLDLETLSATSKAAIVSVGAVVFDPKTGRLGKEFYGVVNAQSCEDAGLHISASTVMWWMKQDKAAQQSLISGDMPLAQVLEGFSAYVKAVGGIYIWGNGSDFDNVILKNAYDALGMKAPWSFNKNRCFRTLKNISAVKEPTRAGTYHNALDDAKHQALWAGMIFRERGARYDV